MAKLLGKTRRGLNATGRTIDLRNAKNSETTLRGAREARRKGNMNDTGPTRREFLRFAGATSLGLPLLATDLASGESLASLAVDPRGQPFHGLRTRTTLYFNLSHLPGSSTHHLYVAGRNYRLEPLLGRPEVLAAAKAGNAFLHGIPDNLVTHNAVDVEITEDCASLGYITSNENTSNGTWEMAGMFVSIPKSALAFAYLQARLRKPRGVLPLSNKRSEYGAPPARTLRDLEDEQVLIDTTSFAGALVGIHPDVLSVETNSAAHIHTNYINLDGSTSQLGRLLRGMGPAVTQGAAAVGAGQPWGTLVLMTNDKGQPFKKSNKLLNQYYPEWNPTVSRGMGIALSNVQPLVRKDPVVGIDVTPYNLNNPNNLPTPAQLSGRLWARHDGTATVVQALTASPSSSAPKLVFTNQGADTGLKVGNPTFVTLGDGRIQITLDNVSNWFLRWLGVWVQFVDANDNVIASNACPPDTFPAGPGPYPRNLDKTDAIFLGVVPPPLAIMGIPIYPGSFSPVIKMPLDAHSVRIFYTGLGLSGSIPQDPTQDKFYDAGALMTMAFNYGVVGLFMAAGASDYSKPFKLAVTLGGGAVAQAIATLVGTVLDQKGFIAGLGSFTMNFLKILLQGSGVTVLVELATSIGLELFEAELLDSIPVAGQIAQAVSAVVGAVQLAETSIEVAISPAAYEFSCVATHDLSITFIPAKGNGTFPQLPHGYSLYYKVSYLFDNGTAHTQDAVSVDPGATTLPIKFTGIPYGGQVNISIGFYARADTTPPGQNDWCAGFASTGLVSNTTHNVTPPNGLKGFEITQIKIPIDSTTRYIHTRKIILAANGDHVWSADANGPPYVPPPGGQTPGLGGFNAITVRQSTADQKGYVGYAWQAYSSGVNACTGNAPGQFDQMANLNTGANAQDGYTNTLHLCGFTPDGVRMGYNLLTRNAINMYLDTTTLTIRPVNLDPPTFAGYDSNLSFGQLNLKSTRCLLHPAGHVVSISSAHNKIETFKLPPKAQSDSISQSQYVARTFSGFGAEPGLMDTPVAAAISPDGAILVLESMNNRIQAFDLGGNSVPMFKNQPDVHFLELPATIDNFYLDLAVEFSGYLYVLSSDGNNNHRLDIYHPLQTGTTPICTTMNVNAARIAVDFWRNLYSLNYEVLRLPPPNGSIPDFTEPSVSLWVPSLPATASRAGR